MLSSLLFGFELQDIDQVGKYPPYCLLVPGDGGGPGGDGDGVGEGLGPGGEGDGEGEGLGPGGEGDGEGEGDGPPPQFTNAG